MAPLEQPAPPLPALRGVSWARRAERPLSLPEKAILSAVVARTYLTVRRELGDNDVREVVRTLRGVPGTHAPTDRSAVADRLARATVGVLRFMPGNTLCLTQSLVLTSLLARTGVDSSLVIGVKPGDEFGAHAWVEVDGRAVLPAHEDSFGRLVEL